VAEHDAGAERGNASALAEHDSGTERKNAPAQAEHDPGTERKTTSALSKPATSGAIREAVKIENCFETLKYWSND
jgi:hypothetical protein